MRKKRTTIRDVAALSGASVATVSRVLSNSDYPITAEMRSRVEEAAKQLEFSYSIAPRQTRSSEMQEIALIIPNISNPFYVQTIQGISSVCYERKYRLVLCNSQWDETREAYYLQDLYNQKISGVIISSIAESPQSLAIFAERGMTIVQLDQRFGDDGSFYINYDSRQGARLAVRHLIENGHRKIAFASTPLSRWTRKEIYRGYLEQLKKAEIEPDESMVFISTLERDGDWDNYEVRAGETLAAQMIREHCGATAVFCVNDMVAIGIISGFKKMGKSVPEDFSVIGVDDIPFSSAITPSLTTIHCPAYETGRLSALMLIDRLQNGSSPSTALNVHLQPTLIERDSVRRLL